MDSQFDVSIIIPFYNEEEGINVLITKIEEYHQIREFNFEIIFIDDGSTDSTSSKIQTEDFLFPCKLISLSKNYGPHSAVRAGLVHSTSKFITCLPADLQVSFDALEKMHAEMVENFDIVFAIRDTNENSFFENLFSKISTVNAIKTIYETFNVATSAYWQNHYQFDRESPKKRKKLSKPFIDLIIINTIIPIQFAYAKSHGKENCEDLIQLLHEVAPEKNAIMDKFSSFGIRPKNAFETQSLLQLKNEFCNKGRCLECIIGMELLTKS